MKENKVCPYYVAHEGSLEEMVASALNYARKITIKFDELPMLGSCISPDSLTSLFIGKKRAKLTCLKDPSTCPRFTGQDNTFERSEKQQRLINAQQKEGGISQADKLEQLFNEAIFGQK